MSIRYNAQETRYYVLSHLNSKRIVKFPMPVAEYAQ